MPTTYDPVLHPHLALQRRAQVLERLVVTGHLTPAQARLFAATTLQLAS